MLGKVSPASDQYALGGLLYELVANVPPAPDVLWTDSHLTAQMKALALPSALEAVMLQALNVRPEKRYPDVVTFLARLNSAVLQPDTLSQLEGEPEPIDALPQSIESVPIDTSPLYDEPEVSETPRRADKASTQQQAAKSVYDADMSEAMLMELLDEAFMKREASKNIFENFALLEEDEEENSFTASEPLLLETTTLIDGLEQQQEDEIMPTFGTPLSTRHARFASSSSSAAYSPVNKRALMALSVNALADDEVQASLPSYY